MTNRRSSDRESKCDKWAAPRGPPPAKPTAPRWSLERLDDEYDLYARRDVWNERRRKGIAWDNIG